MDGRNLGAIIFAVLIAATIGAFLFSPLGDLLSLDRLKASHAAMMQVIDARPLLCAAGYFVLCVVATAICFPAAPVLGVTGGALFGFWPGLAIVLIASSIGSTIAFLDARFLMREWVVRRFRQRIEAIDKGMEKHGGLYLLTVRFNPVIPYWLVNLAMGVTAMRLRTYAVLTLIGLVPATAIYVNAGTQLTLIDSPADVLSANLVAALLMLSLFPLFAAAGASLVRR